MKVRAGVYRPVGTDGFELCHPVSPDDFDTIDAEINGMPRQADWKPISMRLIRMDEGQELVTSDSPWLESNALIFRANAVKALGPLLRDYGELLPLACQEADVSVYNPIRVIDVLDEARSSVLRFDSERIMLIQQHVFRQDVVRGVDIFKIPNLRASPTFVSQCFVEHWNSAGLKGLDFELLWEPEGHHSDERD